MKFRQLLQAELMCRLQPGIQLPNCDGRLGEKGLRDFELAYGLLLPLGHAVLVAVVLLLALQTRQRQRRHLPTNMPSLNRKSLPSSCYA